MELTQEPHKPRVMDTSNGDARRAVAATLGRFSLWRLDLARFSARAERRFSETERRAMLDRCAAIEEELQMARTDLLLSLGDAPQKVAGHSRVVDVERALDNIGDAVAELRGRLG